MIPTARRFPIALPFLAALLRGPLLLAQSADVDDVKRVIRAETETYYQRDTTGWKNTWINDSTAIRTFITSGSYSVALGWDKFGPSTIASIRNTPPEAVKIDRTNYVVRIDGALAYAEYDEQTNFLTDSVPLVARQNRTLVKRNGEWRILSAGSFVGSTYGASPRAIQTRLAGVGSDLSAAKKHDDAIEVLELNVRLFPSSSAAHAALAAAHAAAGNTGLARQHYEKALAIDPKNETARTALAKLTGTKSP
ncbi:MAG TPA: tetratricopeptide repeat protein [Gemmatimonadaceae bacterium]